MGVPMVYRSLEDVLKIFNDERYTNLSEVQRLLSVYKKQSIAYNKIKNAGNLRRHKFIVLEGLDGSGKSTISKILKEKGFGVRWCTPPYDLRDLRSEFDANPALKTAFYALGNYIAAMQVASVLRRHNVVMDRYWHSTAAFALGRAIKTDPNKYSLPSEGDEFYRWPHDLLKPDKVFFLHVSEEERLKRLSRRTTATDEEDQLKEDLKFRQTIVQAYRNMFDPGVVVINSDGTKEECVEKVLQGLNN